MRNLQNIEILEINVNGDKKETWPANWVMMMICIGWQSDVRHW